jgi:4-amino-4-deoxy-L-arabinose transferase-like glycosyltransferase
MSVKKFWILFILVLIGYLIIHLIGLTKLPIFSDEAIYIRWAQLIIDDPYRYSFFSLNDGKTPLFIWAIVPFQYIFSDQLFAGRILAVIVGLLQTIVARKIISDLGGSKTTQLLGMILISLLPFWYFHHRIALMDSMLVLFIALAISGTISLSKTIKRTKSISLPNIIFVSMSLAAALLTKVPAILAFPSTVLFIASETWKNNKLRLVSSQSTILIFIGTILIFGLIGLNPASPQLFSRGGDFLFSATDFFGGAYKGTIRNIPNYLYYFVQYLSPYLMIIMLVGLFKNPQQKRVHQFFWAGVIFAIPIFFLGKVVYPRYLLPSAWFFTLAITFSLEGIVSNLRSMTTSKSSNKLIAGVLGTVVLVIMAVNSLTFSLNFIITMINNPANSGLVSADREQYLTKWSSGHGILETVNLIRQTTKNKRLAVATEGYFGTLPDGILAYLHRSDTQNLMINGIGQPVTSIPEDFTTQAKEYDEAWLVVNSDRMNLELPPEQLIHEFCRPDAASCLQIWNITNLVKN